ncbi:hypothetical protein C6B32_05505 [Campylobacter fetus subsp. testudinum]|nr:hypothetical protein C6B32_05505 [Campylobacter fetus subsp. testudinum]
MRAVTIPIIISEQTPNIAKFSNVISKECKLSLAICSMVLLLSSIIFNHIQPSYSKSSIQIFVKMICTLSSTQFNYQHFFA